jgi:hypothetical protein
MVTCHYWPCIRKWGAVTLINDMARDVLTEMSARGQLCASELLKGVRAILVLLFIYFCHTGVWTQGLPLVQCLPLFLLLIIFQSFLAFFFSFRAQTVILLIPSYNWDYRCAPHLAYLLRSALASFFLWLVSNGNPQTLTLTSVILISASWVSGITGISREPLNSVP